MSSGCRVTSYRCRIYGTYPPCRDADPGCVHECTVECGLPVETEREYTLTGAGFGPPGTECVVSMRRVRCVGGHIYDEEISSVEARVEPDVD